MSRIEDFKTTVNSSLSDASKPWKRLFDLAEEKSGVPRLYLFSGGLGLCVLYLVFGCGAQLLSDLISVAYPAYVSIKAIESHTKADDTKWLTYWVLYATFSLFEFFSVFLTSFIPLYWLLKCIFFIYCMVPIENNGSVVIYKRFIRPYFLKHQATADQLFDNLTGTAKDIVTDAINKGK